METINHKGLIMRRADREEFYDTVGPLDVHPHITNPHDYDEERGYTSEWKTRAGAVVGLSYGTNYYLVEKEAE
ncbi:hypothetical protein [Desulfovibrio oxyclinae]|uniref:hypothetical protein n=1 Tax=Desulfovibrio oxyclinae TaxID=63560 RepID=UPI0003818C01|nr:hypothetical protein [Desulfovibrio oxyclinae]